MTVSHHYFFGHIVLRTMFFNDPILFTSALSDDFLQFYWDDAGNYVDEKKTICCDELTITQWENNIESDSKDKIFIISFPTPEKAPEVFYVGLVLKYDTNNQTETEQKAALIPSFITLEKSKIATVFVLGTWDKDGNHGIINLLPDATIETFGMALTHMEYTQFIQSTF